MLCLSANLVAGGAATIIFFGILPLTVAVIRVKGFILGTPNIQISTTVGAIERLNPLYKTEERRGRTRRVRRAGTLGLAREPCAPPTDATSALQPNSSLKLALPHVEKFELSLKNWIAPPEFLAYRARTNRHPVPRDSLDESHWRHRLAASDTGLTPHAIPSRIRSNEAQFRPVIKGDTMANVRVAFRSTAMTLRVTPRRAESTGLYGFRGFGQE